jgi:hypothetical protein
LLSIIARAGLASGAARMFRRVDNIERSLRLKSLLAL